MTENKRFTYMEQFNGFCDVYDDGKTLSCMRLEYVGKTVDLLNSLDKENKYLKSTIAELIEQNRKNNDLLLSDIRILEKELWCKDCANDYGRLRELRKEFLE